MGTAQVNLAIYTEQAQFPLLSRFQFDSGREAGAFVGGLLFAMRASGYRMPERTVVKHSLCNVYTWRLMHPALPPECLVMWAWQD